MTKAKPEIGDMPDLSSSDEAVVEHVDEQAVEQPYTGSSVDPQAPAGAGWRKPKDWEEPKK